VFVFDSALRLLLGGDPGERVLRELLDRGVEGEDHVLAVHRLDLLTLAIGNRLAGGVHLHHDPAVLAPQVPIHRQLDAFEAVAVDVRIADDVGGERAAGANPLRTATHFQTGDLARLELEALLPIEPARQIGKMAGGHEAPPVECRVAAHELVDRLDRSLAILHRLGIGGDVHGLNVCGQLAAVAIADDATLRRSRDRAHVHAAGETRELALANPLNPGQTKRQREEQRKKHEEDDLHPLLQRPVL
jgi:hypothetical protein